MCHYFIQKERKHCHSFDSEKLFSSSRTHLKDDRNNSPLKFNLALLFLIYTNDLPNGLNLNVKLFAYNTSLFSVVHNITHLANLLSSNLSTKRIGSTMENEF